MAEVQVDLSELPSLTNPVYYPLYNCKDRYLVLYGGAGSGKSVFACQKLIVRLLSETGHRVLIVRKVAKTLRHSVFALMQDTITDWGLSSLFKINIGDMRITCRNGNQVIFAGLDDVEKLKSITGITIIWIEEASEIAESDFIQLDLRLRGMTASYKQIILSFNPISALSWLKKRFFDFQEDQATVVKTTYKDNRFIDAEYKAVIEGLRDQDYVYYQVYALGEWGVLGNLILTNWVQAPISTDPNFYGAIYPGMDFGFIHASAYIEVAQRDNGLYVIKEFKQKGLTNTDLIAALDGIASKDILIIADSAEPDRIVEFRRAGYRIEGARKNARKEKAGQPGVKQTASSVKAGIDFLRSRKIYISDECPETVKEVQGWKYREDKDGNVIEEPVELNDDLMAALRYAIEPLRNPPETSATSSAATVTRGEMEGMFN